MNDEDIHSISGAYVVDAVDDVERAQFDEHLQSCPPCKREVKGLQRAVVELSQVTPVSPPASLRASVLLAISQVRPLPPVMDSSANDDDNTALPGHTAAPGPTRAPTTSLDTRRGLRAEQQQRARRDPARWLIGVAAAALLVIGGVAWHPWSPGQGQNIPQLTATQQVLQAKDAQPFEKKVGSSTVKVVRSKSLKKAVMVTANLPAIPAGKVYELWLLQGQTMVKAGFVPRAPSSTVLLQGDAATAAAAGITVEPAGGSLKPSQSPVAVVGFA
jgi:anti-sigma-K factor RskA